MPRVALKPGQTSIDTSNVVERPDGGYRLQWSICLNDGKILKKTSKGPTKGETRANARRTAAELLRSGGNRGTWTPTSLMSEYIEDVSIPVVTDTEKLKPLSKTRYLHLLDLLIEQFEGYKIVDATRFRRLEEALQAIANDHGWQTGRQAKNVLSRWVLGQMIRDELIEANPLLGMPIELGSVKKTKKSNGGQALSEAEYRRALDYLLSVDVTEVEAPKRGRYQATDRIAQRRATVEMALLQATTGLRISEARQLYCRYVSVDDAGRVTIHVGKDIAKGSKPRDVEVLDSRVAARIAARLAETRFDRLFGSPAAPTSLWDTSNAQHAMTRLMREIGRECKIPLLSEVSTHVWRATLNTMAMSKGVPAEIRAAWFGHGEGVNVSSYTDTTDTTPLVDAMRS